MYSMDKKIIITIILATLLAFLCAYLFLNKNQIEEIELEQVPEVQVEIVLDEASVENKIEKQEDNKQEIKKSDSDIIIKPVEEKIIIKHDLINRESEKLNQEVIPQVNVSKEEVIDAGIIKNSEGVIEITREFRANSSTKYSFKDFGIIDKSSK